MKISCKVKGKWIQVPVSNGENSIIWLGHEAMKRYQNRNKLIDENDNFDIKEIRKAKGDIILDFLDPIKDVLDDNDFVKIVLDLEEDGFDYHHINSTSTEFNPVRNVLLMDGKSLLPTTLRELGKGLYEIKLTQETEENVMRSRRLVEKILKENNIVYGVNTGFGSFATTLIGPDKLEELQSNVIRSCAAGVGNPLCLERTRMLLALKINNLANGHSGISLETLNNLIAAFNENCLPWIPERGTVGASGDLAPLSHLALGLSGEGKMWSPMTGWGDSDKVLRENGLKPLKLGPKEGLSLINGTQLITSLGAEAVERASCIARQADIVAAMSLEALKGTTKPFEFKIQATRPHKGQMLVAERLKALLHSEMYPSEISLSHKTCDKVQDAYTLRCCPQVHGIVNDTIRFVRKIITTELNSTTDNPIVFPDDDEIISAGNFHGEYPAKALDFLAIAVHELASISERRIERLVNSKLSGLPGFLVKDGGLNCGFMVAHCTAAALVSENKVLCHPSSVDSLSTSAAQEDHVSMGGFSARKCLSVIENVENVLAIELLAACQGIEFLRPLKTTLPLEKVHELVRKFVRPFEKDRYMAPDIEVTRKLLVEEKIWTTVEKYINK